MAGDHDEPEVLAHEPMPKGYRFVPKGNVYITKNCRKKTHEAERTLYVVVNRKGKPMGLRCPAHIHNAVMSENKATAAQRAEAVQKRDAAIEDNFEEAIVKLFPKIPKSEVPQILKHTLKKHSRRVGRTGTVALQDRVKLAVRAHIRHVHTEYDGLLKHGASRPVAREKIWDRLNEVARQWGGRSLKRAVTGSAKTKLVKKSGKKTMANVEAKKAAVDTTRMKGRRKGSEVLDLSPLPSVPIALSVEGLDVDTRDAIFTTDEETSDLESDGSEWSL
ncbi:hypothetical protein CHGG_05523 [Chaetomium globosum CBS 148.51]|uniref:DUF2293 domain-containing protein n=1 Tax=Chaetomium globosum (strain ATCC 6205 / CBS 148.51 / DSM 1962 / NBRC 6347 / NRRL 1970) TaxID=306901 RepID=Q2H742_CHAGB|nr:uncharacterized protein CHGG_05523 [Chaetomium globosum CBS 148.51]EAQ88904.1 hypothetical protein CHGG_05523 [Chaetomium globosum CBS 148.51]